MLHNKQNNTRVPGIILIILISFVDIQWALCCPAPNAL
jgi:hypothetical protein